jgi:hypothetical protein
MTLAHAFQIPSLDELLSKTASSAHAVVITTYEKMSGDQSVGKTRKQSMEIGGWGMTSQREKERLGYLQTWADGGIVRVSTVSIYTHILDTIVASNPIDGPRRYARTPTRPYGKGHRSQSENSPKTLSGSGSVSCA